MKTRMPHPLAEKNRRILIIDDNHAIHDDFRKILSPAATTGALDATEAELFGYPVSHGGKVQPVPYEIDSAYQGQDGVQRVKQALEAGNPYAMAFVDVRMPPGMDGVETALKIWELDPDLQVVLCTAYSDYSWGEMFEKLGRHDGLLILKKPFDTVEALQLAHALTEKWWLHQQSRRKMEELEGLIAERTVELQRKTAFLEAQVNSSIDGILVVDQKGKKAIQNQRVADLFKIPRAIADGHDDAAQVKWVTEAVKTSGEFADQVAHLYSHPDEVRHDEIELKDGTILDRYSGPVVGKDGKYYGRIWTFRDITGRKQAEEALQQERNLLRTLIDHIPDNIFVRDLSNRFIVANESFARLMGVPRPAALIGKRDADFYPPELAANFDKIDQEVFAGRQILNRERVLRFPNGQEMAMLNTKIPFKNEQGKVIGLIGVGRDITERKRAEEALRANEKRLREINVLQGLLLPPNPLGHKLQLVTEAVVRMVGADFARVWMVAPGDRCATGCIHAQVTEGPHVCRFRDQCLHLLASSGRYTHINGDHGRVPFDCYKIGKIAAGEEPKFLTNDATHDPRVHNHAWARELGLVSFAGYRLVDSNGVPIGVLAVFSKQPILAEEDLLLEGIAHATAQVLRSTRAEAALSYERDLWRTLLDNSPDFIYFKDTQSRFIKSSKAQGRQFGVASPDEMVGKTDFDFFTETHARPAFEDEQEIIRTGRPIIDKEEREEWKDGHVTWAASTKMPMRDTAGKIIGIMGISRDITERKRLESHLIQSQKMETVGKLAGGIAHEFNSILTAIIGQSELLLGDLPAGSPLAKNAAEISRAADRAATLTRQLLAYGRKQFLRPETLNLNQVISSLGGVLGHLMGGELVDVSIVPAPGLHMVKADAGQIEQVIMNLAMNARDAMPHGGKLTLETANVVFEPDSVGRNPELKPGAYVMLAITDTGRGMSEKVKAHAFEPFFTTKDIGQGTGLGLSTCYGIIKQSGGHINLYSEPGRGTTFKIYLPQVAPPPKTSVERLDSPDMPRGTETILLVEDDPALREMAATLLRRLGYTVLAAANGIEALSLKQQDDTGHVDLLFTDVVMPHMSGKELADRMRALYPHTRILFTSAYSENAIVHQGVLDKGVALLQKPFTPSALALKMREVLNASGAPKPATAGPEPATSAAGEAAARRRPDTGRKASGSTKDSDEAAQRGS
jgi:two-component system, cell cycle sensor histidine kinase and response regulator CckA